MYVIVTQSKYFRGSKTLTNKKEEAKVYPSMKGAKGVIARLKLKKARVVELELSEKITKFSNDFDNKYQDNSKNGLITIKKKSKHISRLASTNIAELAKLAEGL